MRTVSRALGALGVAVLAAFLSAVPAFAGTAVVHRDGTLSVVSPSSPSAAALAAPTPAASSRPRGARRSGHTGASSLSALNGAPAVAATPSAGSETTVELSFNGVSSHDSAVTNFGHEFEPPDQGLCVGNGYVVEPVNSAYTVYNTAGKALAGPFNVNGPFNEGLNEFTSDPRCMYDAATNTWFATILWLNQEETASALDVAVNTSGDPRKPWTTYRINTTGLNAAGGGRERECPCFGDQPTLALDAQNVYVTTNDFSIQGPQFNGAQIYALAKKDLVALQPVHVAHFRKLDIGGAQANSIQPAISGGSASAEYFLNSIDPTETFDDRIGVWALTNKGAVAKGELPTLSSLVLTSEAFGIPPKGEQKGASSLIETGDDRMQQTQFAGGSIWGELDTAATIEGDPEKRAAAAWFQVRPTVAEGVLSGAKILKQGYLGVPGAYVMYPAIQVTASGAAVIGFSITSSKRFPSAGYSVLEPGASTFGPVGIGGKGTGPYNEEAERWGDYSWAILDPSGSSVWLADEYVPPKASQTPDGRRNWGTRVYEVKP